MLIRFSVENYLSFRDRVELSMIPGPVEKHAHHVVQPPTPDGIALLKTAIIYGANASGKSNLVKAIFDAQRMIMRPAAAGGKLGIQPFKLDPDSQKRPSRFEFEIKTKDHCYAYGFAVTTEQVEEEWLYRIGDGEYCIFERKQSDVQFPKLDFQTDEEKQFLQFIAKGTLPNRLFLSECKERNVRNHVKGASALFEVLDWFDVILTVILPNSICADLGVTMERTKKFQENLTAILRAFDTGIVGIDLFDDDMDRFPDDMKKHLTEYFDTHPGELLPASTESHRWLFSRDNQGCIRGQRLVFRHGTGNGKEKAQFEWSEESDGTQRLIDLAPAFMLLEFSDRVFIIDEFDRSLHPDVAHSLIDNLLRHSTGRESQLIVTTHETTLLNRDFLRRDEIWLMEKGKDQASHLIALEEFKNVPENGDLQRDYLQGRFGGVPVLKDLSVTGCV